jgi:hypothetical protein
MLLDGFPHPPLIVYLVLEITMGIIALIPIRRHPAMG